MRRAVLSVAAGGVIAVVPPALPAAAEPGEGPVGRRCGHVSGLGSGVPESESGVVYGGPYLATGTLTCTVHLNGWTHGGPAGATLAYSATGTHVTYLPPTPFAFAGNGDVVVCTSFQEPGGPVLYWEPGLVGGRWTTDPNAGCAPPDVLGPCIECPLPPGWLWDVIDPVLCEQLVAVRPSFADPAGPVYIAADGDVALAGEPFWDCPPYGG